MTNGPRILVRTRDLFFRATVEAGIRRGGGVPVVAGDCAGAVLEAEATAPDEVEHLTTNGVQVLVFAPHLESESLRAFRTVGSTAVPNSRLVSAVADLLNYLVTESEGSSTQHDA